MRTSLKWIAAAVALAVVSLAAFGTTSRGVLACKGGDMCSSPGPLGPRVTPAFASDQQITYRQAPTSDAPSPPL